MSSTVQNELPKQYRPADHEARIWDRWQAAAAFHADPGPVLRGESRPYCIVIPPPNVTDRLHLGHALNNALQDILVRAHRMMGYETLWMPGTDHAGIATQAVIERRLKKDEGKTRQQIGREAFVAKVQAFKDEYEAIITGQLKAMGCSCDWERQRFTMDEQCARAVREAFFRLFRDGLIYRGKRLVNWDPALQTAVSDDECYDEEIDAAFYYLRYPLVHAVSDSKEDAQPVTWNELARRGYPGAERERGEDEAWVTVATTRPETYLGDTAVAVNPKDRRAKALRGLFVELPLVGRLIPVIEDDYVVLPAAMQEDPEEAAKDPKAAYATGFLKVTPAHDPNDYDIGQRHKLPLINVMAPDATISDKHGWTDIGDAHIFVGKKREDARKLVVKEFESRGWLEGVKPYRHSIKHSDRSKAVIEPYLSDQWYVRVTDPRMAEAANRALVADQRTSATSPVREHRDARPTPSARAESSPTSDGALRFYPSRYSKTYEQWHDGIRDWCISRQLWWGHRIPVWHRRVTLSTEVQNELFLPELDDVADGSVSSAAVRVIDCATGLEIDPREMMDPRVPLAGKELDIYVCDLAEKGMKLAEDVGFVRDPDVLDTWFSSALWPMSTMGWPDYTDLLKAFNPTTTLCTAREIITLWVSRMVMFNRYLMPKGWPDATPDSPAGEGTGPLPYRNVFIHAVIQDGEGRKMSKMLGNGVDPLDIIATHGSDAMRFTLCHMTTQTQDVRMPVVKDSQTGRNTSTKFDLGRNFANKLWNAARFALGILDAAKSAPGQSTKADTDRLSLPDRWMLSRLAAAAQSVDHSLANFEFSDYATTMYNLVWNEFCDWYLEAIKPTVAADPRQRAVLAHALETIVRLVHPVMPYVTETLFERVREVETDPVEGISLEPSRKADLLCTAGWPRIDPSLRDEQAEAEFSRLQGIVTAVREVRAQHNVKPSRRVTLHVPAGRIAHLNSSSGLVMTLAGVESITADAPGGTSVPFTHDGAEFRLSNLADAIDAGAEAARRQKAAEDLRRKIAVMEARLANPGYAQKAPPAMVQETKDQLAKARAELDGMEGIG